jgi:hypothetical protein
MKIHPQKNTHLRAAQGNIKPKHLKKLTKPTQEKIGFKKSPALKKNATHNRLDNDTETQHCQWFASTDGHNTSR